MMHRFLIILFAILVVSVVDAKDSNKVLDPKTIQLKRAMAARSPSSAAYQARSLRGGGGAKKRKKVTLLSYFKK